MATERPKYKTWTGSPDERFTVDDWNRLTDSLVRYRPELRSKLPYLYAWDSLTAKDARNFEYYLDFYFHYATGETADSFNGFGTWRSYSGGSVIDYKRVNQWEELSYWFRT